MRAYAAVDFVLITGADLLSEAKRAINAEVSETTLRETRDVGRAQADEELSTERLADQWTGWLLREHPELLDVQPARGGTFTREQLVRLLGEEGLRMLEPLRGVGGTVPRTVLADLYELLDIQKQLGESPALEDALLTRLVQAPDQEGELNRFLARQDELARRREFLSERLRRYRDSRGRDEP